MRRLPAAVAEAALAACPVPSHLRHGALQLREPRRPGADRAHGARAEAEPEGGAPARELLERHEGARRHRGVARDRVRDRGPEADPASPLGGGAEEDVELAPEHRRVARPDAAEAGRLGELDALEEAVRRLGPVHDEVDCRRGQACGSTSRARSSSVRMASR